MDIQIVLVMETNEKSKSDYMYIRSILNCWYDLQSRTDRKIVPIFMNGKGNYKNKRVISKIEKSRQAYRNGDTCVVYCFDTDKYDTDPNELLTLTQEQNYCTKNGYEFVWFCHDIEEVFLGKSIPNSDKTDKAREYMISNGINNLQKRNFEAKSISNRKSNLLRVLDKYM